VFELPAGSVTFLFTDVEGSTRLLGLYPKAYAAALLRHDALLRRAVARQNGVVFETVGDAVYAAFRDPLDAVRAALDAQRSLQAEKWGELGQLRVRMALHTGEVERRGEHYFGAPLYRCARLMAIGYGGQTLLSSVTAEAVRERLPDHASLRPMGVHRLKDLAEPEEVFQLDHPDLTTDFPPLKSLDPRATNLPPQTTSFVGRKSERSEVARLLHANRLVTLTGPGGTGKTRLGLQVAADVLPAFDDGVFLVSLAAINDPELVGSVIAKTLEVREEPRESVALTLSKYLTAKELLLLLDNFEQVMAAASLLTEIVSTCPKVKMLVTSRVALRLSAEHQFAVPPLALAERDDEDRVSSQDPRSDAVVLFLERALAVHPQFAVTDANLLTIAEICGRLEGLPLSIELAAARSKLLSPSAMLPLLNKRLAILSGGPSDKPDRQRSVRATIAWSHALLSTEEQRIFARLGVFAGGFTLSAAEAVCEADLDGLASLLDKSLLRQEDDRFSMLETIREYALEQLAGWEGDEAMGSVLRHRHAEHFAQVAAAAAQATTDEAAVRHRIFASIDPDFENHRSALTWSIGAGDAALAVGHLRALRGYLFSRGRGEPRGWLEQVVALPGLAGHSPDRMWALGMLGELATDLGDFAVARSALDEALALARALKDAEGEHLALTFLGEAANYSGDYERAEAFCEEALAVSRRSGLPLAEDLHNLGAIRFGRGDLEGAAAYLEEALALANYLATQLILGELEQLRGNRDRAGALIVEAYERARSVRSLWGAVAPVTLAWWYVEAGEIERAAPLVDVGLRRANEMNIKLAIYDGLEVSAAIAALRGDPTSAAELQGAAAAFAKSNDMALGPARSPMQLRTRTFIDVALGKDASATAYQRGLGLSASAAVDRALALVASGSVSTARDSR
jgi:predicted ATPase/class 3 adenylate cyclase